MFLRFNKYLRSNLCILEFLDVFCGSLAVEEDHQGEWGILGLHSVFEVQMVSHRSVGCV